MLVSKYFLPRPPAVSCAVGILAAILGGAALAESDVWIERGRAMLADRRYPAAAEVLARAVRAAPDDGEAQFLLGLALFGADRYEEAIAPLARSVELLPTDPLSRQFLGRAYFQVGRLDDARDALLDSLAHGRDDVSTINQLGAVLLEAGDPAGALLRFEEAIELAPDYAPARFNAGIACYLTGDLAFAEVYLARAVDLEPREADAAIALGDLCAAQARDREARDWYSIAAERLPGSAAAAQRVADASRVVRDFATADWWQRRALALDPSALSGWRSLASIALRRGDFSGMRRALEGACAASNGDPADVRALVDFLEARGEYAAAHSWFAAVLRADPTSPTLLARGSRLAELAGDVADAKRLYDELVAAESDAVESLRAIAQRMLDSALDGIRNHDLGHRLAAALVERSSGTDAAALVMIARYETARGNRERAAEAFERAAQATGAEGPAARVLLDRAHDVLRR